MSIKPVLFDINETRPDSGKPGGYSWFFQGCSGATIQYTEIFDKPETFPHKHDYEQVIFVMEGSGMFWCGDDGESYELKPGCIMVCPPNVNHGIESVAGDGKLKLFEFFYPKQPQARVESPRVKDLGHKNWPALD